MSMRRISIVFPAYNEARRIPSTIDETVSFCRAHFDEWEIIVVDDGSTDDTRAKVEFHEGVRYLRNERNQGKGVTVRRGMLEAALDPVLFSDVDLSTPIEEALGLHGAIERGNDVAIATRVAPSEKAVRRSLLRRLLAFGFRSLVRLVALRGISDTQCGFKMFRRDVARDVFARQELDGWAFDVEVLFLCRTLGYSIAEVPVEWQESDESSLSFWSPFQMARDILKIRWIHRGLRARRAARGVRG